MRRFPCSWDQTLAALGFRRKPTRKRTVWRRSARLERLEVRTLLSADGLSPASVIEDDSPAAIAESVVAPQTLPVTYSISGGEHADLFQVSESSADQRALLSLAPGAEVPDIDTLNVVVERSNGLSSPTYYSVSVVFIGDVIEAEYYEQRVADAASSAADGGASSSSTSVDGRLAMLSASMVEAGPQINLLQASESARPEYDELLLLREEIHDDRFIAKVKRPERLQALGEAGLLLADQISADLNSADPTVVAKAAEARDTLEGTVSPVFTAWTSLDINAELTRSGDSSFGYVAVAYDEGAYGFDDYLALDLGGKEAVAQAKISTGLEAATYAALGDVIPPSDPGVYYGDLNFDGQLTFGAHDYGDPALDTDDDVGDLGALEQLMFDYDNFVGNIVATTSYTEADVRGRIDHDRDGDIDNNDLDAFFAHHAHLQADVVLGGKVGSGPLNELLGGWGEVRNSYRLGNSTLQVDSPIDNGELTVLLDSWGEEQKPEARIEHFGPSGTDLRVVADFFGFTYNANADPNATPPEPFLIEDDKFIADNESEVAVKIIAVEPDGTEHTLHTELLGVEVGTGRIDVVIPTPDLSSMTGDYSLYAVLDARAQSGFAEGNLADNALQFAGGILVDTNGDVHVHGSEAGDTITIGSDKITLTLDSGGSAEVYEAFFVNLTGSLTRIYAYAQGATDVLLATSSPHSFYGYGGTGNDLMVGSDHFDILDGGEGDDTITGHDGGGQLNGGYGNDLIDGGLGSDAIYGGFGDDVIDPVGGMNSIYGDEGDDTVELRTDLGAGITSIYDGAGNDSILVFAGAAGTLYLSADTSTGADGFDVIDFSNLPTGVAFDLGSDAIQYDVTPGLDVLLGTIASDPEIESLIGTEEPDLLIGNALDNTLLGLGGDDILRGEGGADYIVGGAGNDLELAGGPGDDYIYGDEGNDTLKGGDDEDYLFGGLGDDSLDGGDQDDLLDGGDGVDTYPVELTESYQGDAYSDPDTDIALGNAGSTNRAPVLDPVANRYELALFEEFSITFAAADPDTSQVLLWSLAGEPLPAGATWDAATHTFTWTPDASSAGSDYVLAINVQDNGSPILSASAEVKLAVASALPSPAPFVLDSAHDVPWQPRVIMRSRSPSYDGRLIVEEQLLGTPNPDSWRVVWDEDFNPDVLGYLSWDIDDSYATHYGTDNYLGHQFRYRMRYETDDGTLVSEYTYAVGTLPSGYVNTRAGDAFEDFRQLDQTTYPDAYPNTVYNDVLSYENMEADKVVVTGLHASGNDFVAVGTYDINTVTQLSADLLAIRLYAQSNGATNRQPFAEYVYRSQDPSNYIRDYLQIQAATPYRIDLAGEPFTRYTSLGSTRYLRAESLPVQYDTYGHYYVGTNNDYDRELYLTDTGEPIQDGEYVNYTDKVSLYAQKVGTDDDVVLIDLYNAYGEIMYLPEWYDGAHLPYSISYDPSLLSVVSRDFELITPGVYDDSSPENPNLLAIVGTTPSSQRGDTLVTIDVDTSSSSYSVPLLWTVLDIDLEVSGLDNLSEHKYGAVIQSNTDFTKGYTVAGVPLQDNRVSPATGQWTIDTDSGSPTGYDRKLVPATLTWNGGDWAQPVHEDLDIVLSYPDNLVIWNVTDGLNEVIASGVPFQSTTDGMDLLVEGLSRSDGWATQEINVAFVYPNNANFSVDTDTVKYTVVEFHALVDGDRDGFFNSTRVEDRSASFWYNSDVDRVRGDNTEFPSTPIVGDSYEPLVPSDVTEIGYTSRRTGEMVGIDSSDQAIRSTGDLEDFLGVQLFVDSLLNQLPAGATAEYRVALEDRVAGSQTDAAVNLFRSIQTAGSRDHVLDANAGEILLNRSAALADVGLASNPGPHEIPAQGNFGSVYAGANQWIIEAVPDQVTGVVGTGTTRTYASSFETLIFDVVVSYDGQHVTTLSSSVELDLHDTEMFYDRFTATGADPSLPGRDQFDTYLTSVTPFGRGSQSGVLTTSSDYLVFVHGWNMPPEWKRAFSDTTMKRLYWQGYTGGLGAFDWPTLLDANESRLPDAFDRSYNPSEFNAYRSASALVQLFADLQTAGHSTDVLAHSMGNVVVSEALRLWQESYGAVPAVGTYIATQAAVQRDAYQGITDPSVAEFDKENFYAAFPPISSASQNVPLYYYSGDAADKWVNIYNPIDVALSAWGTNNFTKKNTLLTSGHEWDFDYRRFRSKDNPAIYTREKWTLAGREQADPLSFGPDGSDLEDAYEILAFFGVSDDDQGVGGLARPLGAGAMGGSSRFVDVPLSSLGYGPQVPRHTSSANHSFQFLYDAHTTSSYWSEIVSQAGLPTSG